MKEFKARNPKQLDLCLKMLYAEGIPFSVRIEEDEKGKVFYKVYARLGIKVYEVLKEKYRILIS